MRRLGFGGGGGWGCGSFYYFKFRDGPVIFLFHIFNIRELWKG